MFGQVITFKKKKTFEPKIKKGEITDFSGDFEPIRKKWQRKKF